MNLNYKKEFIDLPNGEKYAYLEYNKNAKKTLLLIHGNFSAGPHFLGAIKNFKEEYHILAPDMRGFGDSSYNQRITSFEELADDINLFLEAKQVKQAYVLGWSLGGGVAMQLAARHQDKVEKLILMASTTHKGYPVYKKDAQGNQLVGEVYQTPEEMATDPIQVLPLLTVINSQNSSAMAQALSALALKPVSAEELNIMALESIKQRNLIDADWAISNINMGDEKSHYHAGDKSIHNIKCPVLHLWGSKDIWLAPEYMTLDNYNALRDVSKLIYYPNCGHMIFQDQEVQFTKDVINFLNN